nr:uncharacterized protein LOC127317965 isoform X4 [Lolium perenne]
MNWLCLLVKKLIFYAHPTFSGLVTGIGSGSQKCISNWNILHHVSFPDVYMHSRDMDDSIESIKHPPMLQVAVDADAGIHDNDQQCLFPWPRCRRMC